MRSLQLIILCGLFIIQQINIASAQWVQTGGPLGGNVQCIERVSNKIWAGTNIGIYESQNEGFSWQKLPQFNKFCMDILNYHDTIVMVTVEYDTTQTDFYNFFSKTSFDNGATWQAQNLIENSWGYGYFSTIHVKSSLVFCGYSDRYVTHDFGTTWTVIPPLGGQPIESFFTGGSTIAACTWDASHMYYSYFFSPDETQSWQFLATVSPMSWIYLKDSLIILSAQYYDALSHSYIIRKETPSSAWDTVLVAPPGHTIYQISEFDGTIYARTDSSYWASSDAGLSWGVVPAPDIAGVGDTITFPDGDFIEANSPGILRHDIIQDTIFPTVTGMKNVYIDAMLSNNGKLYAISYIDLLVSSDAGQVWQKLEYPKSVNFSGIVDIWINGDTIIAITTDYLIRSFNTGTSWDSIPLPSWCWPSSHPKPGLARRGNELILNTDSAIYISNDLGLNWNSLPIIQPMANPGPNWCTDNYSTSGRVSVFNNTIFAATGDGFLFKYNDMAGTWSYSTCSWMGIVLQVVDTILVATGGEDLQLSYDNGDTWAQVVPAGLPVNDIGYPIIPYSIIDINGVWFGSCYNTSVYYSIDQGLNWQQVDIGTPPFRPMGDLVSLNGVLYSGSNFRSVWRRAGAFNQITGTVFIDENCNGTQDMTEDGIQNIIMEIQPYGNYSSTDSAGTFTIYSDAIGDTLRPVLPGTFTTSQPLYYITNGPSANNDFGICVTPGVQDLSIDITNVSVFRPGFETNLQAEVLNRGSLSMVPHVRLVLDPNFSFISSIPIPDIINGDTLEWNNTALQHFMDIFSISVTGVTSIVASIGDTLHFWSEVEPFTNDININDNFSDLPGVVVGSYDPNDKTCMDGEYFTTQQVVTGDEMEFVVRFQNTGTYPASFIHVIDTLSGYLDPSSFRIISSSHPVQWTMIGPGILDFFFDAINLPPSNLNEPESHGYVKYAIKCKESVSIGNAVTNTAFIFFDYNPSIMTNTTTTAISSPVIVMNPPVVSGQNPNMPILVYPNPTASLVTIAWMVNDNLSISFVSTSGQIVYHRQFAGCNSATIDISGFPKGIYIVKLIGEKFVETRKLIIQ